MAKLVLCPKAPHPVRTQAHLQELLQPQLSELILQVDPEVHILHRVHHNVDKLHAGHLWKRRPDGQTGRAGETKRQGGWGAVKSQHPQVQNQK